jgi:integrase
MKLLPLKVSRRTLERRAKEAGKEILGKDIHFHSLRHGFGSHLAGSGRPIHEVQMLMGHSRLDTTGIYLHANPKQAVEGARDVF